MVRLVFISDTHGKHESLAVPDGDVLCHTGDFTHNGTEAQALAFLDWFGALPHAGKIFIAGNHDRFEYPVDEEMLLTWCPPGVTYLRDSGVLLSGLTFWGVPWIPLSARFIGMSFLKNPGADMADVWALVPPETNVLLAHSPPYGTLDMGMARRGRGQRGGCRDMVERLDDLSARVVAFGHIHDSYGAVDDGRRLFLNTSIVDKLLRPRRAARVVDWHSAGDVRLVQ